MMWSLDGGNSNCERINYKKENVREHLWNLGIGKDFKTINQSQKKEKVSIAHLSASVDKVYRQMRD